jgi:hypothetical protein
MNKYRQMEASEFPNPVWLRKNLSSTPILMAIPRDRQGFLGPAVRDLTGYDFDYCNLMENGWLYKGETGRWKKCRHKI